MTEQISDSAPPLPPKKAEQVLPDVVTGLLLGATVTENYKDGDGVSVHFPDHESYSWHLARCDYERAREVADTLEAGLTIRRVVSAVDALRIRRHADRILRELAQDEPPRKLAMLKDKGSSGWWRMVLPARAMKAEGWRVDCTAAPVEFDSLLEYGLYKLTPLWHGSASVLAIWLCRQDFAAYAKVGDAYLQERARQDN